MTLIKKGTESLEKNGNRGRMPQVASIPNHERLCRDLSKAYSTFHLYVKAHLRRYVDVEETSEYDDVMKSLFPQRQRLRVRFLDEDPVPCEQLLLSSSHVKEKGKIASLLQEYVEGTGACSLGQELLFEGKKIHFALVKYDYEIVIDSISRKFSASSGDEINEKGVAFYLGDEYSFFSHDERMPGKMRSIILDACGGETYWDS